MINEFDTPYWRNYYKDLNEWIHGIAKNVDGKVLSVGSGNDKDPFGEKYEKYFERCDSYTTSDVRQYGDSNNLILDARNMDIIPDSNYDFIFCDGVIEHIDDFHRALSEMTRVLKTRGTLLISFPFNQQMHMLPLDFWRFTRKAVEYLLKDDYIIKEIKEMESEVPDPKFPKTYWVNAIKI